MSNDRTEIKLADLYQEVILDHNRSPRNFGPLEDASVVVHGVNPLCGDSYHLYIKKSPTGAIQDLKFEGDGCAISKASASLMTLEISGKNTEEITRLKDSFIELLTQETVSDKTRKALGKLKIFEGVKKFPVRVKCATLIWRALEEALKGSTDQKETSVSTEKEEDRSPHVIL